MIASLPMYDRPETATAHDALWARVRDGLRARGIAAPDALDRTTGHMEGWAQPDLILGQICNLPYRARFRNRVTRLGAGDYGLPGTAPGFYHSVFIVRQAEAATPLAQALGGRLAYSEALSQSGWGCVWSFAVQNDIRLQPHLRTGAHVESARAVADGRADIAAIDAITWRMLSRWEPAAQGLAVIGQSAPSPGMTFITGAGHDPDPVRAALAAAIETLEAPHRETLGLRGLIVLSQDAYDFDIPPAPTDLT